MSDPVRDAVEPSENAGSTDSAGAPSDAGNPKTANIPDETDAGPAAVGIVAGFDGSPSSRLALGWAADTAALYDRPLTILFAHPDDEGEVVVTADADELHDGVEATVATVRERHPDLDVRGVSFPQPPVQSLLLASETAELLVIGSRGWDGFTGLLVGSTTLHVVPYAKCPVVVLHGSKTSDKPPTDDEPPHAGEVVVAFDGSAEANAAAALAFRHAAAVGCPVAAISVEHKRGSSSVVEVDPAAAAAGSVLATFWAPVLLTAQSFPTVPVTYFQAHGRPGAVLVEQSRGSHLLAFGARGRGGFLGLVMGSVSQQLLAHAQCPVGVLHSTAAAAEAG